MNGAEVRRLLLQVSNLWDRFDVPADEQVRAAMVDDWAEVLVDVDAMAARAAVTSLAGEAFPPKAGAVRERALLAAALAAGEAMPPDADEAWTEARAGARREGVDGMPLWSHPAVADAVAAIGWQELCRGENEDAMRAHFVQFYNLAAARHVRRLAPPPALGPARTAELGRGRD